MLVMFILIVAWWMLKIMLMSSVGFFMYLILMKRIYRKLRTCAGVPYIDCARRGTYEMLSKLEEPFKDYNRKYIADFKPLHDAGVYLDKEHYELVKFIRLCHRVGYEVVIRPHNNDHSDTELNPEETNERLNKLYQNYQEMQKLFRSN